MGINAGNRTMNRRVREEFEGLDTVRSDIAALRTDVAKFLSDLRTTGSKKLDEGASIAAEKLSEAADLSKEKLDDARDKVSDMIAHRPLTSVLVAAAAGAVLARLMRR
ncbi:MAG: hypothetical protein SFZ24_09560 [Planctomycetota bacterium]|nr:hypothetical protein [Planctomycetota bacterium]